MERVEVKVLHSEKRRAFGEAAMAWGVRALAATSIISVILIAGFIFGKALPAFAEIGVANLLFGTVWRPTDEPALYGIGAMIVGSLAVTVGAIVLSMPVGLAAAVGIMHFVPSRWQRLLRSFVLLLAGIPSIVYGFFGMMVMVPFVRDYGGGSGNGIVTAACLLALMVLPTVIAVSEASLAAVPETYYAGGRALGLSHERTVIGLLVPAARDGILAAGVLGIGRAVGETMAVIMVAGNQVHLPTSIWDGTRTLTANVVLEMGYAVDLHRDALVACGAVLFALILLVNAACLALRKRWGRKEVAMK